MLAEIVAVAALIAFSVEDLRKREVESTRVALAIALTAGVKVVECIAAKGCVEGLLPAKVYAVIDAVILASNAVIALTGLHGWGDVIAVLLAVIASPGAARPGDVFPVSLTMLFYYITAMLAFALYNVIYNLAKSRSELSKLPPRVRLVYMAIARPMSATKLLHSGGWWYPLNLCGKYSVRFNIYMDPEDVEREVREAIRRGCLKPEDTVWVSYGVPGIPLLTTAYVAALLIGDRPLLALLRNMLTY